MAEGERVTTYLEVDITNFRRGITDANRQIRLANSEFNRATAGMDNWRNSSEGLNAKLEQLRSVMGGQEAALRVLRAEYERVCEEQGENSAGAQELEIRMNRQEAQVRRTAAQIERYQRELDEMEGNTDDATDNTRDMSDAMDTAAKSAGDLARGLAKATGNAIVTGVKALAAAAAGLVTAFLATAETSKEFITEMGKLDAAYTASGHSAETAAATFEELQSIIGETGQSVEAAQQIALLADSTEDAAKWAEQAAGVVGRFGDALQPEVFFESANETLKLNEATGAYVQMLEGTGYSVDKFNKGLQACKTEAEKQAYMLRVTEEALGAAGEAYRKNNADIIEANKAQAELEKSMAGVGKAATPVMSALKLMGAAVLVDLLPNIEKLGTSFRGALDGSTEAAGQMGAAVGGILQQLGEKIVGALPSILTVGASIITSLVSGLADAGPQLLAAGGDVLDQLATGIFNALPALAQGAMTAIEGFVSGVQTYLPVVLAKGRELLGKLGDGIKNGLPGMVDRALDALMSFATTLYDNAPTLIDTGFDLLSDLVQGILDALPALISKGPEIVSKFANIINDNFPRILKKGVELVGQIILGLLKAIPTLVRSIPKIITALVDVWEAFNWLNLGKKAMKLLKDGVLKMVGAVKGAGQSIMNSITNIIKGLPGKLANFGRNAGSSLANGIRGMISSARSASRNMFEMIINIIKALPGKMLSFGRNAVNALKNAISSGASTVKAKARTIFNNIVSTFRDLPSKMLKVGKDLVKGLWNGISDMTGWVINKIKGFGDNVLGGIKDFFGIESPSKVMRDEVGKWLPAGMAEGITANARAVNKSMAAVAKGAVKAANAELSGAQIGVQATAAGNNGKGGGKTYNFYQYNNSPKALSHREIYRQTKNQLIFATATT